MAIELSVPPEDDATSGVRTCDKPIEPAISQALKKSIESPSAEFLRLILELLCEHYPTIIPTLNNQMLVRGKDVVRYHANSESEDDQDSEVEREEEDDGKEDSEDVDSEEDDDDDGDGASVKMRKLIAISDNEYTTRVVKCENCNAEFDLTTNDERGCVWHPGTKEVDDDSDWWCDHDENCHGSYYSHIDDPDFAEGFVWSCCEKQGDDEGCKMTKHRTKVNRVVFAPPPVIMQSKKRGADEEVSTGGTKRGRIV